MVHKPAQMLVPITSAIYRHHSTPFLARNSYVFCCPLQHGTFAATSIVLVDNDIQIVLFDSAESVMKTCLLYDTIYHSD